MASPTPDATAAPEAPAADATTPTQAPAEKVTPESSYSSALKDKNTIETVGSLTHVTKDIVNNMKDDESKSHFYKFLFTELIKQRNEIRSQKQK
jgi:hypothetical protein